MDVQISSANLHDVYGIREVQKETWLATYPNESLGITRELIMQKFALDDTPAGQRQMAERRRRLNDPQQLFLVAKDQDQVVGFCWAGRTDSEHRIHAIYLLPNYQGQGIGKQLMAQAQQWLGSHHDIVVNVAAYNQPAIGFYERCGFVKTGRLVKDGAAQLAPGVVIPEIEMVLHQT